MTAPALTIEAAFGSGYATAEGSRAWTDITQYVQFQQGVNIPAFGRGDELSTAGPNALSLVLDNRDGRFTPEKTSGAYYPNVKIGVPIRVKATPSGGSASTRFVGYVDDWGVEWPGVKGTNGYAETRVTATSRLARSGLSTKLRSIVEEEYLLDLPVAYYTLAEAAGATFAGDTSGNGEDNLVQAGTGAAVTFGTATGPSTDELTAATFAGGKHLSGGGVTAPTAFTLEAFFTVDPLPDAATLVELPDATGFELLGAFLSMTDTGTLAATVSRGPSTNVTCGSTSTVDDGATHHAAMVYVAATDTLTLYVDGVEEDTNTTGAAVTLRDSKINVGGGSYPDTPPPHLSSVPAPFTGTIAHAAAYRSALSGARIAAHADAGLDGFLDETPGARIERYASYAGVPSAEFDAETGTSPMAHVDTTGNTVLDMMRRVEETEGGVLFDGRDGHLVFHDRDHRYGAAVDFTFNVASGHVQPDYSTKYDRSALVNLADVQTSDQTVRATYQDATSQAAYGPHDKSLELMTTDTDEPLQRAAWEVGVHKDPISRVPTLTVELGKFSTANQALILALTVGDRVRVSNLMSQAPNSTEDFYIEGGTETAQGVGGRHTITFNVSPAEVYDVWLLGDATYGVLGTTTKLAY